MKDEESGSGEPAKATAPHPKHRRKASAITSGRKLFVVGHASRTEWGRRYLDLYRAHVDACELRPVNAPLVRRGRAGVYATINGTAARQW